MATWGRSRRACSLAVPSRRLLAASEWLLRKWGEEPDRKGLERDKLPPVYDPARSREWFAMSIDGDLYTFVTFPPGEFQMGSPDTEDLRQTDEKLKTVERTRSFAMLDREVTVGQWLRFLDAQKTSVVDDKQMPTPSPSSPWSSSLMVSREAWENRDKRAVKFLEPWRPAYWHQLVRGRGVLPLADIQGQHERRRPVLRLPRHRQLPKLNGFQPPPALGGNSGQWPIWKFDPHKRGFRLPLEAEWEYACRAGTTTAFSFGSDRSLLKHFAVFLENLPGQPYREPLRGATRMPNPRGLFDMHGNVSEWCHNWRDDGKEFEARQVDPIFPDKGDTRLYRGGCFDNYSRHCRSACRISDQPSYSFAFLGFRVVCTLPTTPK